MAEKLSLDTSIGMMYFFGMIYAVMIGVAIQWRFYGIAASLFFWGFIMSTGTIIKAIRQLKG